MPLTPLQRTTTPKVGFKRLFGTLIDQLWVVGGRAAERRSYAKCGASGRDRQRWWRCQSDRSFAGDRPDPQCRDLNDAGGHPVAGLRCAGQRDAGLVSRRGTTALSAMFSATRGEPARDARGMPAHVDGDDLHRTTAASQIIKNSSK
jgi:hypothetical protein